MPTPPPPTALPDIARRLGTILLGLAALVARRFLRDPARAALILPLWTHLTRAAHRLNRTFARLAAGPLPAPKPRRPHSGGPHRTPALPTGRAWLVAALGFEAAAYASQLESLLAEPAAAEALALSPTARRLLAPIRRLLGLTPPRSSQPRPAQSRRASRLPRRAAPARAWRLPPPDPEPSWPPAPA